MQLNKVENKVELLKQFGADEFKMDLTPPTNQADQPWV
jgi:hypothetical protein